MKKTKRIIALILAVTTVFSVMAYSVSAVIHARWAMLGLDMPVVKTASVSLPVIGQVVDLKETNSWVEDEYATNGELGKKKSKCPFFKFVEYLYEDSYINNEIRLLTSWLTLNPLVIATASKSSSSISVKNYLKAVVPFSELIWHTIKPK